jgi:hypothetical protein
MHFGDHNFSSAITVRRRWKSLRYFWES